MTHVKLYDSIKKKFYSKKMKNSLSYDLYISKEKLIKNRLKIDPL